MPGSERPMLLYLPALNPTDSVTEGFLPAARRLGLEVAVLTDQPEAHLAVYGQEPGVEVLACDVRDFHALISRMSAYRAPDAIFSNSDHLQTQTALAADYFGLPAKPWQAALHTKDKALMRRHLAATGADDVRALEVAPYQDLEKVLAGFDIGYPCVVKPRQGVASEDVVLADTAEALERAAREIRERRPKDVFVIEEFLPGQLFTLETLGDGHVRHVLGGFRTDLSEPPYFIEERLTYVAAQPEPVVRQVLDQLDVLGIGFGACHTEFVVHEGRARLIEVNYRAIGDQCDLLLADLLGIPLFERILRVHLGESLPAEPGGRSDWAGRLDYPYARSAGTLTAAPDPVDLQSGAVRLSYRPLRAVGEHRPVHHTNRDLLGVVRACGPAQDAVDRAVTDFLAAHRWEITA